MKKLFVLMCILIAGCATPYQPDGFRGGYTETRLTQNTWRVNFQGNGFTRRSETQDYALLRCAELTLQQGYRYFALADSRSGVDSAAMVMPSTSQTNFNATRYGNSMSGTATTQTYGGGMMFVSFPSASNVVVMFPERVALRNGASLWDAQEVCNNLGRSYEIVCSPSSQPR